MQSIHIAAHKTPDEPNHRGSAHRNKSERGTKTSQPRLCHSNAAGYD